MIKINRLAKLARASGMTQPPLKYAAAGVPVDFQQRVRLRLTHPNRPRQHQTHIVREVVASGSLKRPGTRAKLKIRIWDYSWQGAAAFLNNARQKGYRGELNFGRMTEENSGDLFYVTVKSYSVTNRFQGARWMTMTVEINDWR